MRGEFTIQILENIKDNNALTVDLLKDFLLGKLTLNKAIDKIMMSDIKDSIPKEDFKKYNNRFYAMLRKLEKEGLIEKNKSDQSSTIKITNKGKDKLKKLKEKFLLSNTKYKKEKINTTSIIIFDIPEKYRKKRNWLRLSISNMGFNMVQKSVWMGNVKIPKEFLISIKELNLLEYVEIFQITKQGTLKSLK